jgi:hypothetical protein
MGMGVDIGDAGHGDAGQPGGAARGLCNVDSDDKAGLIEPDNK